MAKPPYRPYNANLGSRTRSYQNDEERDWGEYHEELGDRMSSLAQDEIEEFVKTQFNGDYKAARSELERRGDDIYARAKAQAVLDMAEDKVALEAKYPPELAAEREAERERKRETYRKKLEAKHGPGVGRWLARISPETSDDSSDNDARDG